MSERERGQQHGINERPIGPEPAAVYLGPGITIAPAPDIGDLLEALGRIEKQLESIEKRLKPVRQYGPV